MRKLFVVLVAGLVALPVPAFSNEARLRLPKGSLVGAMFTRGQTEVTYYDIFLIGTGDRPHVNLTRAGFRQNGPSWSPDGRSIAYTARSGLFVMDADGGRNRLLRPVRYFDDGSWIERYFTAWSPDGTRIATIEWLKTERGVSSYSLVTYPIDGGDRQVLFTSPDLLFAPDWSPDGSTIAFSSCRYVGAHDDAPRDADCEVHTIGRDGSAHRSLSTHPQPYDLYPKWGPKSELFFTSNRGCWTDPDPSHLLGCGAMYSLAPGATDPQRIAFHDDWDEDGRIDIPWFALSSFRPSPLVIAPVRMASGESEIWSWNMETGARQLLSTAGTGYYLDRRPRCTVRGTKEADILRGSAGRDLICGLGGDDRIRGLGGDDVIFGHAGDDVIDGGRGADIVVGNQGGDRCIREEGDYSRVC